MTAPGAQDTLVLRLAPAVARTWFGLAGLTGQTQLTDRPLMDALEQGATLEQLLEVGTPRAGRDVLGVLDVLHRRQLLAWQAMDTDDEIWATLVPLRSDVLEPALTAFTSAGLVPAPSRKGTRLTVTMDPATAGSDPQLLLMHHLNALPRKAQVLSVTR